MGVSGMDKVNFFEKKGFAVIDINKDYLPKLLELKRTIEKETKKKLLQHKNFSLEKFHKYKLKKISLNQFRLDMISKINKQKNLKLNIYNSIDKVLDRCLGPDIIVQKNINLVIQKPKDKDRAPFHKDAPANSNYEIVVWVPLVDCYNTMGMYLFDVSKHNKSKKFLRENNTPSKFDKYSKKEGILTDVQFGQALIFWTNNYHYIPINKEINTRWTLNVRYKNLFTKYGTKNLLDFYEILKLSPLTKLLNKIDV